MTLSSGCDQSECKKSADAASGSATNAKKSADAAAKSADVAKTSENNVTKSTDAVRTAENNCRTSEINTKTAAADAKKSADVSSALATDAKKSADAASESATNAKKSADAASGSATAAKNSETNAKKSETAAAQSATDAKTAATSANANKAIEAADKARASENNARTSEINAQNAEIKAQNAAIKNSAIAAAAGLVLQNYGSNYLLNGCESNVVNNVKTLADIYSYFELAASKLINPTNSDIFDVLYKNAIPLYYQSIKFDSSQVISIQQCTSASRPQCLTQTGFKATSGTYQYQAKDYVKLEFYPSNTIIPDGSGNTSLQPFQYVLSVYNSSDKLQASSSVVRVSAVTCDYIFFNLSNNNNNSNNVLYLNSVIKSSTYFSLPQTMLNSDHDVLDAFRAKAKSLYNNLPKNSLLTVNNSESHADELEIKVDSDIEFL